MSAETGFATARQLVDGLSGPSEGLGELEAIAWRIGVEVAGPHADDVDRQARFPTEALAAFKEQRLLSALVPKELGGRGASLGEVVGAVRALAFHCTASALVLAMHSIEAFSLVRYGTTDGLRALTRRLVSDQLLMANANSEVGVGGAVGRSLCAVETSGDRVRVDKQALAISYGAHADVIATIARRAPDASEADQVKLVFHRDDISLAETSPWNTMGLRGTCSSGFRLIAEGSSGSVFPDPFAAIANGGGMQVTQLLLSAVWVGVAEAAAGKAHAFVRAAARKTIGTVPPAAVRVAELATHLQELRSLLVGSVLRFEAFDQVGDLDNAGFVLALRSLKVSTSTAAVTIATTAVEVCGMAGFRRDTPYSLDRIVRDAHGGLVMVSNERYLQDNAQLLLARKGI